MTDINMKYQRLAQEYAKLKAQNQVLKKAVVEAQESTAKMQVDLKDKEQIIRRSRQEIDSSEFRSQQMSHRIELLQSELEEKSNTKRGKVAADSSAHGVKNVIDEDLQNKIRENEFLHKQLFEYDTKKRQMEEQLGDEITAMKNQVKFHKEALENLQEEQKRSSDELIAQNNLLQNKLVEAEENARKVLHEVQQEIVELTKMNESLTVEVERLANTANNVIIFNDCAIPEYNSIRILPHDKRSLVRGQELIKEGSELLSEFCRFLKDFHMHSRQRCLLYPVDSNFHTMETSNVKLSEYLEEHVALVQPILTTFTEAFPNNSYQVPQQNINLKDFSDAVRRYVAFLEKLIPYNLMGLKEECESSVCAPALQSKNTNYLNAYKRILPAMSKVSTYLALIAGSNTQSSDARSAKLKFSFQKVISSLTELHLVFKDLTKIFNGKIILEYQLPTTTKSPQLRSSNEFLLASMISLSSISAKLSGFIQSNADFFIKTISLSGNSAASVGDVMTRATGFMEKINTTSPPVSVPYAKALDKMHEANVGNREELFHQLQENANKLQSLEQEKEHWLLETQLLQMKLEKQNIQNVDLAQTNGSEKSERIRTQSASLTPLETQMFGSVNTTGPYLEVGSHTTEELIKQHLTARLTEGGLKTQTAEGKSLHFENECRLLHKHLSILNGKKQVLHDDVDRSSQRVSQLQDELSVTRRSYEEQLSLMSEHLAAMNDKLATQKDEIETLKTKTPKKLKLKGLH